MVSKDQAIGGAILIVCILAAAFYTVAIFRAEWLMSTLENLLSFEFKMGEPNFRLWIVTIPVFITFIAIMFIGAWIGYTMATTPPPKPIEEITTEIEDKKGNTTAPTEENVK